MVYSTPKKRVLFARSLTPVLLAVFGVFSLLAVNLHSPKTAYATASDTVNFQARLQTAGGAIVPDGTYNVEFKLYNELSGDTSSQGTCSGDANCLWVEDYTGSNMVTVKNGYLSARLGSIMPFPAGLDWSQQLYLTMNIGGTNPTTPSWDGEMAPRLPLTASPYAFQAGSATRAGEVANASGSTLTIQGSAGSGQNFVIQDQGSNGTYDLLTTQAANNSFIQLQTSTITQQTGQLDISGAATVGSVVTTSIDTASAAAINVGGTYANAINLGSTTANIATTINGTAVVKPTSGHDSTTAFQVQNASAVSIFSVDTVNSRVNVTGDAVAPTRVNGWGNSGTNVSTLSVSPTAAGNLLALAIKSPLGVSAAAVSGGGVSNWHKVVSNDGAAHEALWEGTVTTSGTSLITVTYTSFPAGTYELEAQEFTAGLGAGTNWSVETYGNINNVSSTTTVTYPSLTATQTNGAYFGYGRVGSSASNTVDTPGFNYTVTGLSNLLIYSTSITGGTVYSPIGSLQSASDSEAVGMIITDTTGELNVANSLEVDGSSTFGDSVTVRAGTNPSAFQVQDAGGGSLFTVDAAGGAVMVGAGDILVNQGGSLNTADALGDTTGASIGTAASTVDTHTYFTIDQTTAGITASIPAPTDGVAGHIIYVSNTGTTSITLGSTTVANGTSAEFVYNGSAWTLVGVNASGTITGVGTFNAANSYADGATVVGSNIVLGAASGSTPGILNGTAQTIAGAKTWSDLITGNAGMTVGGGAISLNATGTANTTIGNSTGTVSITGATTVTGSISSTSTVNGATGLQTGGTTRIDASGNFNGGTVTASTSGSGIGVSGSSTNGVGVNGQSTSGYGVAGYSASGTAGYFQGGSSDTAATLITQGNGSSADLFDAKAVGNNILFSVGATGVVTVGTNGVLVNQGATEQGVQGISNQSTNNSNLTTSAIISAFTSFTIAQTTPGISLNLPAPTVTNSGDTRIIYVSNTGSVMVTIGGVGLVPGSYASFAWNGSVWAPSATGVGSSYIANSISLQSGNFYMQAATSGSVAAKIQGNASGTGDIMDLLDGTGNVVMQATSTGGVVFQPGTDGTKAFQIMTRSGGSGGTPVFDVDTTNSRVGINSSNPQYALDVNGVINSNTAVEVGGVSVCTTSCAPSSGSGNYIQNSTAVQTDANLFIRGYAGSGVSTGTIPVAQIQAPSGQTTGDILDLETWNGASTTVASFNSVGHLAVNDSTLTGAGGDNVASLSTTSALQTAGSVLSVSDTAQLGTNGASITGNLVNVSRNISTNISGGGTATPAVDQKAYFSQSSHSSPWSNSTFTVTAGHSNYYIFVSLYDDNACTDTNLPTVSVGGTSLTLIDHLGNPPLDTGSCYFLFGHTISSTGSMGITVTDPDTGDWYSMEVDDWYNVNQSTPYGAETSQPGGQTGTAQIGNNTSAPTISSGAWASGHVIVEHNDVYDPSCNIAPSTGQTPIYAAASGVCGNAGGMYAAWKTSVGGSQTLSWSGGPAVSGSYWIETALDLIGSSAAGNGSVTGPVASFTDNCTQTAGTCTDSSNVVQIQQQFSGATGTVLNIQNAGAGYAMQIQNGSGTALFTADTAGSTITISGTTSTFAILNLSNAHFEISQNNPPTAGTLTSCGSSTLTFTSGDTDNAGSFYMTGAGSPTSSCTVQVNFNQSFGSTPKSVLMQTTTAVGSATGTLTPTVTVVGTSSFTFKFSGTPASGTKYAFYYWVVQ